MIRKKFKLHSVDIEGQRLYIQTEPNAGCLITIDIKQSRLVLSVPHTYNIRAEQRGGQEIWVEVNNGT